MSQRCINRDNNNKSLLASARKPILLTIEHKRTDCANTDPSNVSQYSSAFINKELQKDCFKEHTDYSRVSFSRNRASFSRLTEATALTRAGHLKQSVKEAYILSRLLKNNAVAYAVDYISSLASRLSLTVQMLINTKKDTYINHNYVENCKNIRFFHKNKVNMLSIKLLMPIY
ncbi:hypothetical protein LCGC14_0527010 [marine sediment metagenome]|uniref:Uncharacterized protein n=1 Tax=marine sediment metagenome TaxID=412755 RepID=A0A0F9S1J1_9ZZZZ